MAMRRKYTAAYKAEIVLELLRGDKPLSRIAAERKIAPNQLSDWKSQALKGLPLLFENEQRGIERLKAQHAEEKDDLYEQIGRLTTQLGWLKKKLGMD
jgi:transposase